VEQSGNFKLFLIHMCPYEEQDTNRILL
jgi:hypothetical protein